MTIQKMCCSIVTQFFLHSFVRIFKTFYDHIMITISSGTLTSKSKLKLKTRVFNFEHKKFGEYQLSDGTKARVHNYWEGVIIFQLHFLAKAPTSFLNYF